MAEYLLRGDDCEQCGQYMGPGPGFPRVCLACVRQLPRSMRGWQIKESGPGHYWSDLESLLVYFDGETLVYADHPLIKCKDGHASWTYFGPLDSIADKIMGGEKMGDLAMIDKAIKAIKSYWVDKNPLHPTAEHVMGPGGPWINMHELRDWLVKEGMKEPWEIPDDIDEIVSQARADERFCRFMEEMSEPDLSTLYSGHLALVYVAWKRR